jgi:hypothetical protein
MPKTYVRDQGEFPCPECPYVAKRKYRLDEHLRSHTGDKPFACDSCEFKCASESSLARHQLTHAPRDTHKCPHCDYTSGLKANLTAHIRSHTGARPFKCDQCDAAFGHAHHLKEHALKHSGERPFKCAQCDYATNRKASLASHMLTHSDAKPFKCEQCDYATKYKSALVTHTRTHTGAKPYACEQCDYKARTSGQLANHMLQHTGEKPYKCDKCDASFTQSSNLKAHKLVHSDAMPQACSLCPFRCRHRNSMDIHLHNKHGGGAHCEHGVAAIYCPECSAGYYCQHKRTKVRCDECGGSALCKTEMCEMSGYPKYRGYCLRCVIHQHPEIPVVRNYKTKETTVADHVVNTFPQFKWNRDKRVEGGRSRRRPDIVTDLGSHYVIVEIDENSHQHYDCSCDNQRTMELVLDVNPALEEGVVQRTPIAFKPIVFVRFNPDKYVDTDGRPIPSCWSTSEKGLHHVAPRQQAKWRKRLKALTDQIDYWGKFKPEKMVEVVELYYDWV